MYQLSNFSGKIKNIITNEIFVRDDRNELFLVFLDWQQDEENELEIVEFFDEEENEQESEFNLRLETERYIKRAKDGKNAYAEISAEFRLAKLNGTISEEAHSAIEKALITVRNEVLAGQWISAKNELIFLGSTLIGVELYNRLLNQINNYISENY